MVAVLTVDSNATGLRIAEELSYKVLPGTPDWIPYEPNSYSDFGGSLTLVARNPINDSRQRKKGVITDLDASGGFNSDMTQTNLQDILQGFFFADFRRKGEEEPTAVTGTTDLYDVASTTGFQVNDLIQGSGFDDAANNVIEAVVTAIVVDTTVEVLGETLVTDGAPAAGAKIVVVGHEAGSADLDVDATGTFPALTSTVLDFTTLGLIPGEPIFIGGDGASEDFVNAVNNGPKRIRTIAATRLEFDKSDSTMVDETGTGLTIRLYFGRVLKNEAAALIVRRSYQLERTLGAPDDALPSQIQAEYIIGGVPSELTFNIPAADKLNVDLSFVGSDTETIDGPTALKTGNRPVLEDADLFNNSSDLSRVRLAVFTDGVEAPTPLFVHAEEFTLTVNNNLTANKCVGALGTFSVSAGTFQVGGNITAFFSDVAAQAAVRTNADITLDYFFVKANAGMAIDVPLIALGDGRASVEQDVAIKIPLVNEAASGAKIDTNLDHTLLIAFFDFLPNAADV